MSTVRRRAALIWLGFIVSCSHGPAAPSTSLPLAAPTPIVPAPGALIGDLDQPVTLVVQNAALSGSVTYTFDVATDPGFSTVTVSASVPASSGDRTSITLEKLPASTTYYWRAIAKAEGAAAGGSSRASFTIGRAITAGAHRLRIDGTATSCGGAFDQPIVLDGNLNRTERGFQFGRSATPCGMCFTGSEYVGMRVDLARSSMTGLIDFNRVHANSPPALYIGSVELMVRGTVDADGTMRGDMTGTLIVNPNGPSPSGSESCRSTFLWSLAPQ